MHRTTDRLNSLRVRDVMTRHVITVTESQSRNEAADVFRGHGISSAPVVDKAGRCVGILSAVDFLQSSLPASGDAGDVGVKDLMTSDVRSVGPDELLLKAAQLMNLRHIHRVPVLNEAGRIEGMISTMDIVSATLNAIDEAEALHFPARAGS